MISRKHTHNPHLRRMIADHYNAEPSEVRIQRCGTVIIEGQGTVIDDPARFYNLLAELCCEDEPPAMTLSQTD